MRKVSILHMQKSLIFLSRAVPKDNYSKPTPRQTNHAWKNAYKWVTKVNILNIFRFFLSIHEGIVPFSDSFLSLTRR